MEANVYSGSKLVKTYIFTIAEDAFDTFGYAGIIMLLVMILTIPMIFISSTIGIIIGVMVGLMMAAMLNIYSGGGIIGGGSTILWAIIAGGIIIWKIASRGESV